MIHVNGTPIARGIFTLHYSPPYRRVQLYGVLYQEGEQHTLAVYTDKNKEELLAVVEIMPQNVQIIAKKLSYKSPQTDCTAIQAVLGGSIPPSFINLENFN